MVSVQAVPNVLRLHWVRVLMPQLLCALLLTVQWERLAFFREWPLGYRCSSANTTSRDPGVPGSACPPGAACSQWLMGVCMKASLLCLWVGQVLWYNLCGINYVTCRIGLKDLGLCLKSPPPMAPFPLSWFPHSFTISPESSSWIKEELIKLVHTNPCLRLCVWRTQPKTRSNAFWEWNMMSW